MYAGILSTKHSAKWLGAHQKLDRLAYRGMRRFVLQHNEAVRARAMMSRFPDIKQVLHFEGVNGPDGIKIKSPAKDEPWHYYNPYDETDTQIFGLLEQHSDELVRALRERNEERAAFESAWLAHSIVDGLTPAHHYPYEQELEAIRGEGKESRNTKAKKLFVKGGNGKETIKKNWQVYGKKGLLSTHVNFEAGVTSALVPLRLSWAVPSILEVEYARNHGLADVFKTTARSIADLDLYERFYKTGWTVSLARDVKGFLLPPMIKCVSLAWLLALEKSNEN